MSGLTEFVRLTSEWIAANSGFDVTVLALQHSSALPLDECISGVRVVRGRPFFRLHKGAISGDLISKYRELARGADVIHLHAPLVEAGLLARLTPAGTPLVASWICDLAPSRRWSALDRIAVAAVRRSFLVCLRRADRLCVLSDDYASGSPVLQGFGGRWTAVYPPDNAPVGLAVRSAADGARRIGFLGRFVEEKGIGVLLDAVPAVLRHIPDAVFVLAGEFENVPGGSEYPRLRRKIESLGGHVVLPGKLSYEALFDFYRSLDVFVLPSVNAYEAFGIVQVEAMKAGVPVVASDLRGVRVPITLTGNGVTVAPGRSEDLARGILDVLGRKWDPNEIARRAWEHFGTPRSSELLADIYRSCLSEKRARAGE